MRGPCLQNHDGPGTEDTNDVVIQDGGGYPSLIRDVIVRLALVYFTIVFKFIFCSAQVFILSRV